MYGFSPSTTRLFGEHMWQNGYSGSQYSPPSTGLAPYQSPTGQPRNSYHTTNTYQTTGSAVYQTPTAQPGNNYQSVNPYQNDNFHSVYNKPGLTHQNGFQQQPAQAGYKQSVQNQSLQLPVSYPTQQMSVATFQQKSTYGGYQAPNAVAQTQYNPYEMQTNSNLKNNENLPKFAMQQNEPHPNMSGLRDAAVKSFQPSSGPTISDTQAETGSISNWRSVIHLNNELHAPNSRNDPYRSNASGPSNFKNNSAGPTDYKNRLNLQDVYAMSNQQSTQQTRGGVDNLRQLHVHTSSQLQAPSYARKAGAMPQPQYGLSPNKGTYDNELGDEIVEQSKSMVLQLLLSSKDIDVQNEGIYRKNNRTGDPPTPARNERVSPANIANQSYGYNRKLPSNRGGDHFDDLYFIAMPPVSPAVRQTAEKSVMPVSEDRAVEFRAAAHHVTGEQLQTPAAPKSNVERPRQPAASREAEKKEQPLLPGARKSVFGIFPRLPSKKEEKIFESQQIENDNKMADKRQSLVEPRKVQGVPVMPVSDEIYSRLPRAEVREPNKAENRKTDFQYKPSAASNNQMQSNDKTSNDREIESLFGNMRLDLSSEEYRKHNFEQELGYLP